MDTSKEGRPKLEIDWKALDTILKYKPSLVDAAELMGCSKRTLERRIKEEHNESFGAYRDKKMAVIRQSLVTKAYSLAGSGNVAMLIFCLKNLCGWQDRHEVAGPNDTAPISISIVERK